MGVSWYIFITEKWLLKGTAVDRAINRGGNQVSCPQVLGTFK